MILVALQNQETDRLLEWVTEALCMAINDSWHYYIDLGE